MDQSLSSQAVPQDLPTLEQAFQDGVIGRRLPGWLRAADENQLNGLGEALRLSKYFDQRVSEVLGRIQGIDAFTQPKLEEALAARTGEAFNAHRWSFLAGHREPVVNAQPVGAHLTELVYVQTPSLEAALRNFTEDETVPGGQPRGNRLMNPRAGHIGAPSASEFAALCRTLDLGGQYQRHLDEVLLDNVPSLLARSQRYAMLVDAYQARLKGVLSDSEHQLVVGLCLLRLPLQFEGRPVLAKRLSLLGCELEQIVVLDIIDEGLLRNTSWRVLVHIPGDPQGAWSAYPNLRYFANALGKRLRTPGYQRFFSRFVRRRHSQAFFAAVQSGYAGVSDLANISLQEHMRSYPQALFDHLANDRIAQIKDDAAMIAVPTAAVDREVQRSHDQRLAAEGWTLLNIAGFFVPAIGVALLAVTAWELLGEVYHGIEAWHDGDTSEALDHLMNVATDVTVMAATAAGVSVAGRVWSRSKVVDSLVPAYLQDGAVKLCQPDLASTHSEAPPQGLDEDAQGIQRFAEQAWVLLDGQHYPVVQRATDGRWQVRQHQGHAPLLCHNGAGAWRLWFEQPAHWQPTLQLFRRLGSRFAQLEAERVSQVLVTLDLDADYLRALHANLQAPGPELTDSVMRSTLDQRIDRLITRLEDDQPVLDTLLQQWLERLPGTQGMPGRQLADRVRVQRRQLFQDAYEALQAPEEPGMATLRRQFPALHRQAAAELLNTASAQQRRRLLEQGRVPLRLAEAARRMARRIRVARAVEALYLDTPQHADLARVALALGDELPGWSEGRHWRLLEGSLQGAVLASHGDAASAEVLQLVHQGGTFQLFNAQGLPAGQPGELFEVMAEGFDAARRQRIGISEQGGPSLRASLRQQASERRAQIGQMLGQQQTSSWWRPPQRLGDGRVGYPLSGRGRGRGRPVGLFATVRMLYPTFNDAQVIAWLNDVQHSGQSVDTTVARLARELEALDIHLHQWTGRGRNLAQRAERRFFRNTLVNCWQRRSNMGIHDHELPDGYRLSVWAVALGELPSLPEEVSYAHVRELSLLDMGLSELPVGFLRAFPNLQTLELSNNRLTRLPANLPLMAHLTGLDLYGNNIVLSPEQVMDLANCDGLEYINLSHNPLGRTFPLYRLDRLRRLHMRATGISDFPAGLLDRLELLVADLRNNHITHLPRHFYRSPIWISSSVMLENNPLAEAEAERLQIYLQAHAIPLLEPAPEENIRAGRRVWIDAADSPHRGEQSSIWDEVEAMPGSGDFFNMLLLLQDSAEFQRRPQALAGRVFSMMAAMLDHQSLGEELLSQATETLHCQDGAALCFSNLELHTLVWRARADAVAGNRQEALLHLGRQLWRLDRLDQVVVADIQARQAGGGDPDQIEVGLAYRLALRDEFDLPAQPSDMLFGEVAGVDAQRIEQARERLRRDETPERLADSLVARTFWQEHLMAANRDRFDELDAPFHARCEALTTQAESGNEEGYAAQMNQVRDEREQARRRVMLELTLPLLAADAQPAGAALAPQESPI
ncbi:NEL-type E3 ubiquitin ligase domain-containing protein [Pseudomonas putida]